MLQDRKPHVHSAVAWSGTYNPGTCWGQYNDELRTSQNRGCVQDGLRTASGLAIQLGVNRALLLCSGPSAMGKLKDTFFLGERSNFKLIIVHRSKEVRAPGGGERVHLEHPSPSSPRRWRKVQPSARSAPCMGTSQVGPALTNRGSEPLPSMKFISISSRSRTVQHRPS